jgi:hypothetical protein
MQMKTAMQELIQSLKAERMMASNEWQMGYQKALSNVILEIESMLEKEKEQIINANRDGVDMVVDKKDFISGEQYYNETYNKQ